MKRRMYFVIYFEIMKEAAEKEGLSFSEEQYKQFMLYKELLQEWNEKINLTAIIEDEQIIKKHFIDSIKAFKFEGLKTAKNLIDVGTGAGFPGIPLKIMRPDLEVVLLDSLNKRVNFLNEVIRQLKLKKISTVHGRAEDFSRQEGYRENFEVAISRAVANMAVLSELCIPYVEENGYFIALKGPAIDEELKDGKRAVEILGGELKDIIKVNIEDSDLEHNLVVVEKIKKTPAVYPRKAGTANKKPLK